jgi:hypothetical protein
MDQADVLVVRTEEIFEHRLILACGVGAGFMGEEIE